MPIISTNSVPLHRALKRKVVGTPYTLGKAVDKFMEIDQELDLMNLSREEIEKLKRFKNENLQKN
jgi:hypothetical protein